MKLADASATGTIRNTDAMPQAWIARFGRTVADQVIDAVESWMRAPRTPGVEVSLAGQRLGGAELRNGGAPGKIAAAERNLADWLRNGTDPDRRRGFGSRPVTERELLTGSSFALTGGEKSSGFYSLWGRGAVSRFDGRDGALSLDGEVASGMLGADWTRGAVTAGLVVSHSLGEGAYRGAAGGPANGAVSSSLTGFYADVLPAFRDIESNMEIADEFHGTEGELYVSETGFHHPLSRAFIRAAQQVGIPYNPDFNGARQEGVGFYQTTTHDGKRWSAAEAFLRKAETRPNLKILTRVARVIFKGRRATGVELESGTKIGVLGEIVMCAGAIETPRLLQLSGVGEAAHLNSHGIGIVSDLPGVGGNYQDHLEVNVQCYTEDPISFYLQDKGIRAAWHMAQYRAFRTGLLTSNVVESGGFVHVSGAGIPDLQFHVLPFMVGWVDRAPIEAHGLSINPCFLRPRSRGSVRLLSSDPREPALFDAGSFSDPEDLELLVRGTRLAIGIFQAPALQKLVTGFALPSMASPRTDMRKGFPGRAAQAERVLKADRREHRRPAEVGARRQTAEPPPSRAASGGAAVAHGRRHAGIVRAVGESAQSAQSARSGRNVGSGCRSKPVVPGTHYL